jgi:predicted P-loop ATPase
MNTLRSSILAALASYDPVEQRDGSYQCNSPFRQGSNSHAFHLTFKSEHSGAYFDHVAGEGGSLRELAEKLGIDLGGRPGAPTKRGYDSLDDYAAAHYAPAEAFRAAGWGDVVDRDGRPAIPFETATGRRWRFADGQKPPYHSSAGYRVCWYGLERAIAMAQASGQALVLCNGEASTVVAQHHRIAAVSIAGRGEKKDIPRALLAELRNFWPGQIIVAYDGDKAGRAAGSELANFLRVNGWPAAIAVELPTDHDLADFCGLYQADSAPELQRLAEQAPAPTSAAPAASGATSRQIIDRLAELGYSFRLNRCDDTVEVNSRPIDDITRAELRMLARDHHIEPLAALEDAYITEAAHHSYHPIHDYLNGLTWDGADHIGQLAAQLQSSDALVTYPNDTTAPLHAVYLRRWLIGAVAKVLDRKQNLLLVLAGPQGIGKSALVRWLCSGLPDLFIEAPINPNDKDSDVRLMGRFIWEVSELDATTRRADVAAIKAFITKDQVVVRKSYGRHDTIKPALASFIGTINESTGFLSDETGSRRFMVTTLTAIDWSYTTIDANQLWAQAVALYHAGESWRLQPCEIARQQEANRRHEVESILEGWIQKYFYIGNDIQSLMTAADIVDHLARYDIRLSGSTVAQAMELSRILTRLGAEKVRTNNWRGYRGVMPRPNPVTTSSDNLEDEVVTGNSALESPRDNVTTCDNLTPCEHEGVRPATTTPTPSRDNRLSQVVTTQDGLQQDAINGGDNLEKTGCHEVVTSAEVVTPSELARVDWPSVRTWLAGGHTKALQTHCALLKVDVYQVMAEAARRWPELGAGRQAGAL